VAEDQNLYWPIIWYWGSMHAVLLEARGPATKEAVYGKLAPAIALAAFPESAAGQCRIACGNQECPNLDHKIKFKVCQAYTVVQQGRPGTELGMKIKICGMFFVQWTMNTLVPEPRQDGHRGDGKAATAGV
jgi:hypothetical protein